MHILVKYISDTLVYIGFFTVQIGSYFYTQNTPLIELTSIEEAPNYKYSQINNPNSKHSLLKTKSSNPPPKKKLLLLLCRVCKNINYPANSLVIGSQVILCMRPLSAIIERIPVAMF